jgi:hypothetical protein
MNLGIIFDVGPEGFPVKSEGCYDCGRFTKSDLKDRPSLVKFINRIVNPIFDGIMETIVPKEEIIEVKKYAREATM